MILKLSFIIALTAINVAWSYILIDSNSIEPDQDPDLKKNISELITSKGYPAEEHRVETEDGYILGVQRIPPRKRITNRTPINGKTSVTKVIFLHHGLLSAGSDWVMNFPNQSLGFILSDAGYDVWIGNARGNTYSRKHKTLKPTDKEFWNFSWDDIALKDLPACIDYILKVTGEKQIHYVGHSMGTTIIFALLSTIPEYNQKVKSVMALAPVANVSHINGVLRFLSPIAHDAELLLHLFGGYDFIPSNGVIDFLSDLVCGHRMMEPVCKSIVFLACGVETGQMNETRIPVYLHHFPAGTSTPTVVHYAQNVIARRFQRFDYGKKENLIRYGQETPPEFEIEKIKTQVALFWSLNDNLADPTDVHTLKPRIKNLLDFYQVPIPEWSHLDFAIAVDAKQYLYNRLLKVLPKK